MLNTQNTGLYGSRIFLSFLELPVVKFVWLPAPEQSLTNEVRAPGKLYLEHDYETPYELIPGRQYILLYRSLQVLDVVPPQLSQGRLGSSVSSNVGSRLNSAQRSNIYY